MPSPFPGMDPFLEHPDTWSDAHNALIAELRRQLGPQLRPRYVVRLEERVYLTDAEDGLVFVGRPDLSAAAEPGDPGEPLAPGPEEARVRAGVLSVRVPTPDQVRETYLTVRRTGADEVVAVVELRSPANKLVAGEGRRPYEEKRLEILGSRTHLVEIDLLRSGRPMPVHDLHEPTDYRILISRSERRPQAELHVFSVRDPIPTFRLPLRAGDEEPEVDLRQALDIVYDSAGYDLTVDYAADPTPKLRPADAEWADDLLRRAGLRG